MSSRVKEECIYLESFPFRFFLLLLLKFGHTMSE